MVPLFECPVFGTPLYLVLKFWFKKQAKLSSNFISMKNVFKLYLSGKRPVWGWFWGFYIVEIKENGIDVLVGWFIY